MRLGGGAAMKSVEEMSDRELVGDDEGGVLGPRQDTVHRFTHPACDLDLALATGQGRGDRVRVRPGAVLISVLALEFAVANIIQIYVDCETYTPRSKGNFGGLLRARKLAGDAEFDGITDNFLPQCCCLRPAGLGQSLVGQRIPVFDAPGGFNTLAVTAQDDGLHDVLPRYAVPNTGGSRL
jgi:hypothetical protein